MAIKGMTGERVAFVEIGQLRKGGTKQVRTRSNGETYEIWGKDLDHFRLTTEDPDVRAAFEEAYGKEPRVINVLLPFQGVEENLDAWREEYVAGGLVHRCDGETMVLWLEDDGSYSTEPKPCPYAQGKPRTKKEPGCKPTARLKVVVPELERLAYLMVLTNSAHDIMNLDAQLRGAHSLRGDLRGIPLQLKRTKRAISTPDDKNPGKRVRREKWLLSIEPAPKWVRYELAAQEASAIPQLPSGNGDVVEVEVVEAEAVGDVPDAVIKEPAQPTSASNEEPWAQEPPPEEPEGWDDWEYRVDTEPLREPSSPAEAVRQQVRQAAGWIGNSRTQSEPATEGQVKALGSLLAKAVKKEGMKQDEMNDARHDVLRYIIGVDSGKDVGKGEASAMISWLKEENSWDLKEDAVKEVQLILEAISDKGGAAGQDGYNPAVLPSTATGLMDALNRLQFPNKTGKIWLEALNELRGTDLEKWPSGKRPKFYGDAYKDLVAWAQQGLAPTPPPREEELEQEPAAGSSPVFLNLVIAKGKHANKTLGRLLIEDLGYVRWLASKSNAHLESREAAQKALDYAEAQRTAVSRTVSLTADQMSMF